MRTLPRIEAAGADVRLAVRASPVETVEGDRREDEEERERVDRRRRQLEHRAGSDDRHGREQQGWKDDELPRAASLEIRDDSAARDPLPAAPAELLAPERRRVERLAEVRQVALDPEDPHQ